ncbi:delphilin-like [Dorcoceras hygrometricum]|uniref:Delphilin-like n=1 Tax=Dorcoceras hygrometricum TaxID=472368 RepID=A0A2Z7CF03_9LAMI|nr:delphilin-like [Dorcoceras hygrometricum]
MAIQVANLLSVAHSHSLEDLKAQQQELNIEMVQSQSSLPTIDYIDSGDVRLAHFYSIANSSCWVRPVFLMNGVWTPVQGPEFWSSSCKLSLFLDNIQMPGPAIQEIFVPHISFIEPDQYWTTVPWLMRTWRWTKVCEEIVQFNVVGGLRPVRKDICQDITVFNLGVERIPADFLHEFARGLASHNFVNLVVQKDLGDTEEVVLTGVEEVDLVSSDVSTVYRSPSPSSPEVNSLEHDLRFALGPAIFSRTEKEERLYFVQIPDSPPAVSPHHESSSSSTDVSLNFDSTDVPVHAQAAPHAPASVDSTKLTEILEDLQSSLAQRIHDSNCEIDVKHVIRDGVHIACKLVCREESRSQLWAVGKSQLRWIRTVALAQHDIVYLNGFDDVSHRRTPDIMTSPSFLATTFPTDMMTYSLHSTMASAFISYSYQINFESVLMIHDHEGMVNMFKALEASGLRRFLGCESILYEMELGHFFDTALIQDEDITCVISGKFVFFSPTMFTKVFDLPTEGITNFSEVPKDKVYDARSLFSQKGVQIDVHGKKKYMKHEFRLLNDILAKAITVKAGSFDSFTVERFQMMTAIQYGLKVNWGKVLFNVLKDMVDRSQKKAKGFAAQISVLLKGIPAITMGDGVPFPSAKVLSMRTAHTYIVTNTTIDARTESEEPGMAKTPKAKKKPSSADEMPVDMFAEFTASKKRSATEADAPIITKKRRTGKSKPSVSQASNKRKRRLVLSRESDDESEERLYFVQSPDSPPAVSPHHGSSSSSTDVSLHFDSTDVPVHAQAATHAPASVEHDLRFALGPAIFSHVEQEERLYFVQSPDSPPAVSPHHGSSSSSTDVSLHFDSTDVPVHAQAATHAPASVDFTKLAEILKTSNHLLLSMQSLLRQYFETACRVLERQSNTHTAQITDLKKGLMGPVGTIFGDLFDIKKKQREQDARLLTMDEQIAAIRNEHLEFQSKIAADMLSLSTQVGDIAYYLRSGVAKKGEVGSSSRPTTVRAQTQTLPPTTGTFEERVAQARRHIIETGQVISVEEAAARVMEADRRESERLDRERRERRQSRSGTYKRRR